MFRREVLRALPAWAAPLVIAGGARAQTRAETLQIAVEEGQTSFDPQGSALTLGSRCVAWIVYDRLIRFGTKELPEGGQTYDPSQIVPELAESWDVAANGLSITFKLREGAEFHNGASVTAADVVWSMARALIVPGKNGEMRAAGFVRPEQFVAVDERTVRVDLVAPNPLALPSLAMIQPSVLNSVVCKRRATTADPWAQAWMMVNVAGGGAYRIDTWAPRGDTVLLRNETWRSGREPSFKRVIVREMRSDGNRRSALLRGDADLVPDLSVGDVAELGQDPSLGALGMPMTNTMYFLGMNTRTPPYDDVRVRQAIAWLLPYEEILASALHGRGRKLWGAADRGADVGGGGEWPRAFPYHRDVARAQALLNSAGLDAGFETALSYDLGNAATDEPVALLIQEALRAVNVSAAIDRRPAGRMPDLLARRELPMYLGQFGTWSDHVEDFFDLLYKGTSGTANNGAAYSNPEMDQQIAAARGVGRGGQDAARRQMIELAVRDVPYVPIVQPYSTIIAQKSISGFVNMFGRQVDARMLFRV